MRKILSLATTAAMSVGMLLFAVTPAQAAGTVINRCSPQVNQPLYYEDLGFENPLALRGRFFELLPCGSGDSGVISFNAGAIGYFVQTGTTLACVPAGTNFYPQGTVYVTPSRDCGTKPIRVPLFFPR